MKKSELIDLMISPACKVMKEKKILASIIIADAIRILYSDEMSECYEKLIKSNNPMGVRVKDDFNVKKIWNSKNCIFYRVYDTMEEGIANYITLNEEGKFKSIKKVYSYKNALSKLSVNFYNVTELEKYINAYQLYKIDQNVLRQIYSGKKNVIEVNKTKVSPEAVKDVVKEASVIEVPEIKPFEKGYEVKLHLVPLYQKPESKKPLRSITGSFYLAEGILRNNKYAIVTKKEYVGNANYIMGYINKDKIK